MRSLNENLEWNTTLYRHAHKVIDAVKVRKERKYTELLCTGNDKCTM